MHVVIVGCGRVGSGLARSLVASGHTVAVVDRQAESFRRLGDDFPGETHVGVGFDRELLIRAGVERAGAVAAVTNGDNSNILIARVARENFGVEHVVARIYDPNRAHVYQKLGIPTVAPALWTIERVLRRLLPGTSQVEWTDPSGQVALVEQHLDEAWAGRPVADLEGRGIRVMALCRQGAAMVPDATVTIEVGDIAYLGVPAATVSRLEQLLGER
ncbi:MAG: potassium channel family protein [Ilumatobacteraceae bacterium]